MRPHRFVALLLPILPAVLTCTGRLSLPNLPAADPPPTGAIVPRDYLILPLAGRGGRSPVHTDALEAQRLRGTPQAPKAGDALELPDGRKATWQAAQANADGVLQAPALRSGYARTTVTVDADRVMILEASGHSYALVNGEPRTGDPYSTGYVRLPVLLKKGENELLFQIGRGRLQAKLEPPPADLFLDPSDATLPDLLQNTPMDTCAGVVLVNATAKPLPALQISARVGPDPAVNTPVPQIPPLSVRKVPIYLSVKSPAAPGPVLLTLELQQPSDQATLSRATLSLRVRKLGETVKRTFRSAIDDSVQYYAVRPGPVWTGFNSRFLHLPKPQRPMGGGGSGVPPQYTLSDVHRFNNSLVLSLHGAGVEAIGQADAYGPNPQAHIVCPTNRRPFGFDWEDWGRWDAMEVLALAEADLDRFGIDFTRVYLTGHSMGGHGTWQLGALFPDRFAAIGPSAGWPEFALYGGGRRPNNPPPVMDLILRAGLPSETRRFARNYAQEGVYILHGDADDNVPVSMARIMRDELTKFHKDFRYHEQPGAGHWWSVPNSAGAACVDWPEMFDFFARRVVPMPLQIRHVEFVTPAPAVSDRCHWVSILQQQRPYRPSSVSLDRDLVTHRLSGRTENVARLKVNILAPGSEADWLLELDGQTLSAPKASREIWLVRRGERWEIFQPPIWDQKGPHRAGPFKEAFRNRMMFVYGTTGTPEENAWALAKARFDAETFWYRGNGSIDVIPDTAFDPAATKDRNIILYGHADMNRAWAKLLTESPVQVRRSGVTVGERTEKGDDLACLFVRPRPDSHRASVGVVAGSGLPGLRLTNHLPVFISGVAYPDWVVIDSTMLTKGADGLRGAGFFGNDWSLKEGESVWR